jgi:hypothetical protein
LVRTTILPYFWMRTPALYSDNDSFIHLVADHYSNSLFNRHLCSYPPKTYASSDLRLLRSCRWSCCWNCLQLASSLLPAPANVINWARR